MCADTEKEGTDAGHSIGEGLLPSLPSRVISQVSCLVGQVCSMRRKKDGGTARVHFLWNRHFSGQGYQREGRSHNKVVGLKTRRSFHRSQWGNFAILP